ncbi:hypothetical protein ACFL0V_01415 [Nanoarchaeota archaeon]
MSLDKIVDEVKDRESTRFRYMGNIEVVTRAFGRSFEGQIDTKTTSKVKLEYNPEYAEKKGKKKFKKAFGGLTKHELNHKGGGKFGGCPRTFEWYMERFIEPIGEVLQAKGIGNVPIGETSLYAYMGNLVTDMLDNFEITRRDRDQSMFLLFEDTGEDSGKFTKLYDAFVQLQEVLCSDGTVQLDEFYSGDDAVDTAIENVLKRMRMEDMKREEAFTYCMNPKNWEQFARVVAEEFIELVDKNQLNNPMYVKKEFVEMDKPFEKDMKDEGEKMKRVLKKYKEVKTDGGEFKPPVDIEDYDALNLLYQRLAKNLEIKTRPSTMADSYPSVWYGRRDFEDGDSLLKAKVAYKGRLALESRMYHEDEIIEYTERVKSMPEIKFVLLDTSGSMRGSVNGETGTVMNPWAEERRQWTDTSKYHHALVGWYGLIEFLRVNGSLKHTSVKLANYSSATKTAADLKKSKRLALHPQFGSTSLDMNKVRDMFGRKQLVISLSDGDMGGWGNMKDEYIRRAKENFYVHLQIGGSTAMTEDLEDAGLHVEYVTGEEVGKMMIDLTRPYVKKNEAKGR